MKGRTRFDELQERWLCGEHLSVAQEAERRRAAESDPIARQELRFFDELAAAKTPQREDLERGQALVSRTLAAHRGLHLRVVMEGEGQSAAPAARAARRSWGVLAAAALAVVAVVVSLRRSPNREAPVLSARSAGSVLQPAPIQSARTELVFASGTVDVDGRVVAGTGPLTLGQRVETRHGHACLSIDPAIDVCLDEESGVTLESLDERKLALRVSRGRVIAALAPRPPGGSFELRFGQAAATAHGTVFAVENSPEQRRAGVVVIEGKVAVSEMGRENALVGAHQRVDFATGAKPATSVVGRADEGRLQSLLAPRRLFQSAVVGVLSIEQQEPGMRVWIDELGPFELPFRAYLAANRHRIALGNNRANDSYGEVEIEPGATHRLVPSELSSRAEQRRPLSQKSVGALLADAREQLKRGDARGARGTYERLRDSYPQSPEAFTVLVTLGKIELQLGAPARGLSAFDAYLEHGGPLLPEALAGRIRALRALGRDAEERAAIERYLASYPEGFDAPALRTRLHQVSRR